MPSWRASAVPEIFALALVAAACTGFGTREAATAGERPLERADSAFRSPRAETAARSPRLRIRISPVLEPTAMLDVTIVARGSKEDLARWIAPNVAFERVIATDSMRAPIGVSRDGARLTLDRVPGEITFRYSVPAGPFTKNDSAALALDPNRARLNGDRLLVLPEAFVDRVVPVDVSIDTSRFAPGSRAASSFSVAPPMRARLSAGALFRTTFIAGPMGQAVLDGPEGHDETAWLGYTSFDPRSSAAEVAAFRSAVRDYFHDKSALPATLLLVSDDRAPGEFEVLRRAGGVLVHVAAGQTWNGPLRVSVAHRVLHEWIGPTLSFVSADPVRRAEGLWFDEGVSRYLARELTFRFGLLTPVEYLAEIDELERIALTSPFATKSNLELARLTHDPQAVALIVARGARHATRIDASIREKSAAKRSLDGVLSTLYEKAVNSRQPLPESAWTDALAAELDAKAVARFRADVLDGKSEPLPANALGKCFVPEARRFDTFSLGFAPNAEAPPFVVASVDPKGPAARAGLRAGDRVTSLRHRSGDPSVPVRLELERDGASKKIEYRPAGLPITGQGFRRVPTVPDDQCPRR